MPAKKKGTKKKEEVKPVAIPTEETKVDEILKKVEDRKLQEKTQEKVEEETKLETEEPMIEAKAAEASDAVEKSVDMEDIAMEDNKKDKEADATEDFCMEGVPARCDAENVEERSKKTGPVEDEDAVPDSRPKIPAEHVHLNIDEATPNVMTAADGRLLLTLCDGGFQYLLAGVRTNVCVKAGRYMFEVKIIEMLNPYEGGNQRSFRTPMPRQLVRLGFSLANSTPLLDDGADNVYFDCDGNFVYQKKRIRVAPRLQRDQIITVMVNLDTKTSSANTMSLFCDGKRLCEPQQLPDNLVGKPLYPTITYKNVTLQINLGPTPKKPLPFKCRMLRDAAAEDLEMCSVTAPLGGRREVLFPIGLPDQGLHDWLDQFLERNPRYVEISDRKILEWAQRSGLFRPKGYTWRISNDKPGMNFGIPMMDDGSIQRAYAAVAPALKHDLVVMELRSNLLAAEREKVLSRYPATDFKRVAVILMGEPPAEYKTNVQDLMLKEKIRKNSERRVEERRRNNMEMEAEEGKRTQEAAYRENDEEDKDIEKPEGDERDDTEVKERKNEEEKDPTMKEGDSAPEVDHDVSVELTTEEKASWYRTLPVPDLTPSSLSKSFADFSLPRDDEGFDEIRYVWQNQRKCSEILKEWILERKKTQRVEDLEPSSWFKGKHSEWQKAFNEWKKKQAETKEAQRRRAAVPVKKEVLKKPEDDKKDDNDKYNSEDENEEEKASEDRGPKKEKDDGKEEAKPMDIDEDELDVFAVENIFDIGNGKPLFGNFVYEDWTLLSLRYELHLLVHAFRHDIDDPDRPGFHHSHLAFYYNKYFKKGFNVKYFGCENLEDLIALIKDTISINSTTSFVEAVLPLDEPFDKFLRFTEDHRRERQRCIDAGDETALLKFTRPTPPPQQRTAGAVGQRGGCGGHQRPSGGGQSRGPHPHMGKNGPSRGNYTGGARSGYGTTGQVSSSRMGYTSVPPLGSQKRPYTPPPPSPYPPSKHQRYGSGPPRGSGGYTSPGSAPPRGGYGGSGSSNYGGRSSYR